MNRPRVTFHSTDSNSTSGVDVLNKKEKVDSDNRAADHINVVESSEKGFGRNLSSEARLSAGWSTMDSQYRLSLLPYI